MAELIRRLQEAAEAARKQADQEAQQLQDETDRLPAADGLPNGGDDEAAADEQEADEQQQESSDDAGEADNATAYTLAAGASGCSSELAAAKRRCVGQGSAAEAEQAEHAGIAAPRYVAEVTQLHEAFPEFDKGLIAGLLEDQGGDSEEVHAYLKVMVPLAVDTATLRQVLPCTL